AFAASKERLFETTQQGGAFAAVTNATWHHNITAHTYPVALGVSAAAEGIDLKLTQEMYLHAFLSNLIAAAQRLLPVGQTQGQQILHRLTADIPTTAYKAQSGDLTALTSTAFMADIAAMQHETQTTRIFRT
ncbi:MAG: urease accessory protein UreF, partial [Planktomarina sp.]